ncbi:MAG: RdgB/HAM1 family non-canonical purine NTP pyrophosphatase [Gammaproteobacteria bacterium]|nr:RdgB/HAM1 family non-canonical purine NTP pyrophosphatase [Gammaproteobacteria bacterium]MDH5275214.1 RdgB/HAM1 family non-canonical purine NTP pyrophosphatase [Gammaproteobacteria bacterium]
MADLVLASGNPGKVLELQALLGSAWRVRPQSDFDVVPVEETGTTFLANALLKARNAARLTGLPALADDSGLEVDALNGAPGVHSARFAGPEADDAANNARLLAALSGVPDPQRTARYRCVLVWISGPDDPAPLVAEGVWEGRILTEARGRGGFGYDPLFFDPESGLAAAELAADAKNARSHRGQAIAQLRRLLPRPAV